jgi:hypothetical protein
MDWVTLATTAVLHEFFLDALGAFCKVKYALSDIRDEVVRSEVEFTIFPPSRVYLGFLKSRLESRFQEVAIHQFRAKNATRVAFFTLSRVFQ